MSTAMTWREYADARIGRCRTCDGHTWRGRCPGCEQRRHDTEERRTKEYQ